MRFLALAMLAAALPFAAVAQERTDLNMVVSLDRSESVNAEEAIAQIQGLIHALTHERFIGAIQSGTHGRIGFAVVKWSSFNRSEVILPWTVIADLADAEAVSTRLYTAMKKRRPSPDGTQTDLAFGIAVATAMLDAAPYRATRDVINIVGDGLSNIGRLPSVDRDIALSRGITINACHPGDPASVLSDPPAAYGLGDELGRGGRLGGRRRAHGAEIASGLWRAGRPSGTGQRTQRRRSGAP